MCDSQVCLPADNGEKSGPSHQTKFTTISEERLSGKTERIVVSESEESSNQLTGYRIIDIEVLKSVLEVIASCPKCDSKVKLLQTKKQGLSFEFQVACQQNDCDFFHSSWTSKKKKKKRNFDVNSRIYYAKRRMAMKV